MIFIHKSNHAFTPPFIPDGPRRFGDRERQLGRERRHGIGRHIGFESSSGSSRHLFDGTFPHTIHDLRVQVGSFLEDDLEQGENTFREFRIPFAIHPNRLCENSTVDWDEWRRGIYNSVRHSKPFSKLF